jgi:hypothetical protein
MSVIEIAQQWIDELAELQQNSSAATINASVTVALQQYLFRQRQEKIARERRWYEAHHPDLVQQYRGQHIAVHNGQVIDADQDGRILSKRIRQQYGRMAIAMIHVADIPAPPIHHMHSPKLAQLQPT